MNLKKVNRIIDSSQSMSHLIVSGSLVSTPDGEGKVVQLTGNDVIVELEDETQQTYKRKELSLVHTSKINEGSQVSTPNGTAFVLSVDEEGATVEYEDGSSEYLYNSDLESVD